MKKEISVVQIERGLIVDSTNYIHKFKTFVNWLSENNNCSQEFKEKMVNLFKLEHFTSSELSTCVRESSLYSDAELMDVLRKKIEDMVNDHAALEKEKEAFQSKLTKVKNDHDALVKQKCSLILDKAALQSGLTATESDKKRTIESLQSKVTKLEDEKRKIEISAKNTKDNLEKRVERFKLCTNVCYTTHSNGKGYICPNHSHYHN